MAVDLEALTLRLLDAARAAGAEAADAVAVAGDSLSIEVRSGALEHAGGNPPQPASVFLRAGRAQAVEDLDQARQLHARGVVTNPAQQRQLERGEQACRLGL